MPKAQHDFCLLFVNLPAMQDIKQLELSALYELLAEYTSRFTHMLANGASETEFTACKETIVDLQLEIESRKLKMSGIS